MIILKTRVESIRKVPKLSAFLYNIFLSGNYIIFGQNFKNV